MSIVTDLLPLFPETMSCQPGTLDNRGTFTAVGLPFTVPARFEGQSKLVRTSSGQEKTSTLRAIVASASTLSADVHRFTIPARFTPNTGLSALGVEKHADAEAFVYQEVLFP